jgi:hypothetical protein
MKVHLTLALFGEARGGGTLPALGGLRLVVASRVGLLLVLLYDIGGGVGGAG